MNYWLFQVMYDSYPNSWEGMIKNGIAAQHYPLSRNWIGAKRNNNALRRLRAGDIIVAAFKDHRFAGYGMLTSNFYVGGPSLKILHLHNGELMEFHERFDCDWTSIPLDRKRPFISCDDVKKQGFDIDMLRGQCVKQIEADTFKALKLRLDDSGSRIELSFALDPHVSDLEPNERQYWLWVTRPEFYMEGGKDRADLDPQSGVESDGWWTCHKDTKKGDLIFLWRAKLKRDIGYLIQAESPARSLLDDDYASSMGWKNGCNYRVLYKFVNPVHIKDIRSDSYFHDWSPLKRNFQGSVFPIEESYWNRLNQIAIRKNPDYKYGDIISPRSSAIVNATVDFTASEYALAFQRLQIAPNHLQMLLANYYAPKRTLTANMMANAMGYEHYGAANLHYGKLGGLVGENLGWHPLPKFKINVLVDFEKPSEEWLWTMKPVVAEAIELLGWNEDASVIPEEVLINENKLIYEGAVRKVSVNAYERSSIARAECLSHYGCKCTVCGRKLSDIYGEIAQGFIHVHHLRQLSEINSKYKVDPIADLRPVCPTCHSIIHLRKIPYTVEEVRELIKSQQERQTHIQHLD